MQIRIVEMLNAPGDLVLEFLASFARFEYALKRAGYLEGNESCVIPNWSSFAADLAQLDETHLAPVFQVAEYLETSPPMKQVIANDGLGWARLNPEKSRMGRLLFDLRTIRNNLFHGGKFMDVFVEEPARDERLIRAGLAVLDGLLEIPRAATVAEYYREGLQESGNQFGNTRFRRIDSGV